MTKIAQRILRKALICRFHLDSHTVPALTELEKRHWLRRIANLYNLQIFIETGTYRGETAKFMSSVCDKCISIELDRELVSIARKELSSYSNIHVYEGSSEAVLPSILETLAAPALFWLDAHYSYGQTSKGHRHTPIRDELELVMSHPIKGHVIAIDDAREFLGMNGYPTIAYVKRLVRTHGLSMRLSNDIIVICRDTI